MATKKTQKPVALEPMDFTSFLSQNMEAQSYSEITVDLQGEGNRFTLKVQGRNHHGAMISAVLRFNRGQAILACFDVTSAMVEAHRFADHQELTLQDFPE